MTDKPNLQMGSAMVYPKEQSGIYPPPPTDIALTAMLTKLQQDRDAWKAMAGRLYKSAICDCTEGTSTVCARCLNTIQAYTNLQSSDEKSRSG